MHKFLVSGIALFTGFSAWTLPADAGLLSSKGPVIAILAGDLYTGEALGHLDGSGTVWIQSRNTAGLGCHGQFTSSAELGGVGSMQCSDGVIVAFQFKRITVTRGHGTGSSSRGTLSFTYGLSPAESKRYLTVPPGKALMLGGKDVALVDLAQTPDGRR